MPDGFRSALAPLAPALALALAAGLARPAWSQTTVPEIEPNETKVQATPATLADGDALTGFSTGNSTTVPGDTSADTFLVRASPRPLAIYRHRLMITTDGPAGFSATLRGLAQIDGAVTTFDNAAQISSAATIPAYFLQWYGFGRSEPIYVRVNGAFFTTGRYFLTLNTDTITPQDLGSLSAGNLTISTVNSQISQADTDLWVFDAALNPIPGYGNDDEPAPGTGRGSILARPYSPGTYYLALTTANLATHLTAAPDDRFQNGTVMDFPGPVMNSGTSMGQDMRFTIDSAAGTLAVPAIKPGPYEILWYRFVVSGVAPSGGCCFANGSCQVLEPMPCLLASGVYRGDGTACSGCAQPGACCLPDGSCTAVLASECNSLSGVFRGDGAPCATAACPPPGACCLPDGSCALKQAGACAAQSGLYRGDGTACATAACPPPGACCLSDTSCVILDSARCAALFGVYRGAGSSCATAACSSPPYLWNNGPLATGVFSASGVVAPGESQWSELQADSAGGSGGCANLSAGSAAYPSSFRLADDFAIADPGGWEIDRVYLYEYRALSSPVESPFTGATLRIWRGRPGDAGSTIVFGDTTTNRLTSSVFSGLYRIFSSTTPPPGTPPDTDRPIYRNELSVGVTLPPGVYWLDWSTEAGHDPALSNYNPLVTLHALRAPIFANARQATSSSTWLDITDPGSPAACADVNADLPFLILGSVRAACYANCDGSTHTPFLTINDFVCFQSQFAAGQPYANCDGSTTAPILTVNDFICFQSAFAAGCSAP